jgi:hypothetical protein
MASQTAPTMSVSMLLHLLWPSGNLERQWPKLNHECQQATKSPLAEPQLGKTVSQILKNQSTLHKVELDGLL